MKVPLSEFGVNLSYIENKKRDELIKEIYLSNAEEIDAYFDMIQIIKRFK
ncbi:MAG: hypothetical protein ACI37S_04205 [Candidatus Gastranaerophilaceae bacterium]